VNSIQHHHVGAEPGAIFNPDTAGGGRLRRDRKSGHIESMLLRDNAAARRNQNVCADPQAGMSVEAAKVTNHGVAADFNQPAQGLNNAKAAYRNTVIQTDFPGSVRVNDRPAQESNIRPQENPRRTFEFA
jgi:hypothetical protein